MVLFRISRTIRSAVSRYDSEAGGSSKLPGCRESMSKRRSGGTDGNSRLTHN